MDNYLMLAFVLTLICGFFGVVGGLVWFGHYAWRQYYRRMTRQRLGQTYERRWKAIGED